MIQSYIIFSIIFLSLYLATLLLNKRYKLFLPSTIHTFTWLITSIFMYLELDGKMGYNITINEYSIVAEYILYLMLASIVGFSFAHLYRKPRIHYNYQEQCIPIEVVEAILKRFHWLLYVCLIVGIMQVAFLVSIGGFESLEDYRIIAVSAKRSGYGAIAQQLSGHMAILGSFYLSLLGYKHSISGVNLKEFIKIGACVALLNMAIGGRGWILTITLPYAIAYFYGMYKHKSIETKKRWKNDKRKFIIIGATLIFTFSIIGLVRNTGTAEGDNKVKAFFNKFLYYTDGPKMANMVMTQYPPSTYPLEYGKSEFLQKWIPSPMSQKFAASIEDDIALSVTVKSAIPYLYYDWGYIGGIFMWGIYAFILEVICISLLKKKTIFSLLIFVQLAQLLFQSPIGNIFIFAVPVFQWLVILYLLRKYIFKSIPNINKYI